MLLLGYFLSGLFIIIIPAILDSVLKEQTASAERSKAIKQIWVIFYLVLPPSH
jgi:hypothetical protein